AQKKGVIRDDLAPGFILATALGIAEGWFLKRGWNQHCVDEIPRDPSRADEWYRPQFGRFLERALAPK
ncbi:MAG: hypothetical protein H5U40_03650, partial [Polyangiaceae bacterium]|nr:hypothetical protein [Polyangiaceae bacterium]